MQAKSIWIVEDEPSVGEVVSLYLRQAGFAVRVIADGGEALAALAGETAGEAPALVILDRMLPTVDGMEIARRLRRRGDVPIIMLTARREEVDRIDGLEQGADDYVVKPFSPPELVSRVRAVLRRAGREPAPPPQPLAFGDLRIDPGARAVTLAGAPVELAQREFDLLWWLAQHANTVFNRAQLLEAVWGDALYTDPGTVTVHIRRLREKIEANPAAPRFLQTVWGVGYRFSP